MPPAAGNPTELLADRAILAGTGSVSAPPPPDCVFDEGPDEKRPHPGSQPQSRSPRSPCPRPSAPSHGEGPPPPSVSSGRRVGPPARPQCSPDPAAASLRVRGPTAPAAARRVPRATLLSEGGSQNPCCPRASHACNAHAEHGGLHLPSHAMPSAVCRTGKSPGPGGRSVALALPSGRPSAGLISQNETDVGEDPPQVNQCRCGQGAHGGGGAGSAHGGPASSNDLQSRMVGEVAPPCPGNAPPPRLSLGHGYGVYARIALAPASGIPGPWNGRNAQPVEPSEQPVPEPSLLLGARLNDLNVEIAGDHESRAWRRTCVPKEVERAPLGTRREVHGPESPCAPLAVISTTFDSAAGRQNSVADDARAVRHENGYTPPLVTPRGSICAWAEAKPPVTQETGRHTRTPAFSDQCVSWTQTTCPASTLSRTNCLLSAAMGVEALTHLAFQE